MVPNTLRDQPYVSFCCEPGLYLGNSGCYADESFSAEKIILPEIYHSNLSFSCMSPDEFLPRIGGIDCVVEAMYNLHYNLTDNIVIYLLENGTIYVNDTINGDKSFGVDNYCFASQMIENGTKSVLSVCLQPRHIKELRYLIVNTILPIVSIPFVLAILIIHATLREMRNVQGHIFRTYIAALLVMFVTTAEMTTDSHCRPVIIITLQFALLASFFWMTVMAFDIWWTFGGLGSLQRNSSLHDRKKLIFYSCYAWGIPALITGTGAILDFLHVESKILIRPGINIYCKFTSDIAHDIYATGPVTSTMIFNVFFFAWTAIKIIRQKRSTARQLEGTDSRRHNDNNRERFNLYLKLFIVMGISRLAGLLSWRYYTQLPDYIWYCLAVEGSLQGPIIFVIYVWKPNTKKMLLNRLGSLNNKFRRIKSNNSNQPLPDTNGTIMSVITSQLNTGD